MLLDPETVLWNPAPRVLDEPTAADWCRRGADWGSGEQVTFSVLESTTGQLVGNICLHHLDSEQASADIGYRVAPWARGGGVATASVRAVSGWAFAVLGLERIQLFHALANPASCRVAQKAGYRVEGTLRAGFVAGDGRRYDEHLHARLRTDGRDGTDGTDGTDAVTG